MMISIFAAFALVTASSETLVNAENLGRDLALGQICEALQRATVNYPYLLEHSEYIHQLAAHEGISPSTIEDLFEKGHADTLAEIEKDYPLADKDPELSQLFVRCDVLITDRPGIFTPYVARS